ncbi:CaiB/BaiF CoA transferase family protein [Variovorax terrae]|uniref:CoA transferase n=1 Tax=Variovorax terrae TaxID=2923278 RepID=A0A9X1VYH3_9BURK|nr:CoA transferase [Variovorax terrae]MCJ0765583.1 CoA transferase [Variovorax terrae]
MHRSSPNERTGGPGPLTGRRLIDFSQGVAGPSCAMLLADLGADVIKVEPPEGDWARGVGHQVAPSESSAHLSLNRNKRSICLDLKHPEGRAIAARLAARSDIVVQNFRPGVMEKFGLGYDTLAAANPRLVYASIHGFGEDGPLAGAPATDSTMQAFGGLMSINGDGDGPPLRMGNMVSDMLAGSYLCQGVLAALLALVGTGRGQRVNVSLLDALVAFQAPPVTEYALTGIVPQRSGRQHPMIVPSGTYEVRDGFVTLVATQPLWRKFCTAIGQGALADDARFATAQARLDNRAQLQDIIVSFFSQLTQTEALQLARQYDLVCAPINDYAALLAHEQVAANRLVGQWEHAALGTVPGIRNPIRYGGIEAPWSPPPMLGEHTRQVLAAELGMAGHEIDALTARAAVVEGDMRR